MPKSLRSAFALLNLFLLIFSLIVSSTDVTAEQPALERVYYDYVDEQGQLRGGTLQVAFEKPLWAQKGEGAEPHGASNNRVDIVVVGDGYTAAQQTLFHTHADSALATMFNEQPFATYAPLFQTHQIEVISNESGVDNDPVQGVSRNTALDMGFWCNDIERLLCVSVTKAYNAAAAAPDVDLVLAVANSTKYGGAGYTSSDLATASGGNGLAAEIAIHEFGHSLGNLADEYDYGGSTTYEGPEPDDPNVSIFDATALQASGNKWALWLNFNDPAYDGLVSTFEGAMYSELGIYRPTNDSKMRSLGRPFNHPSAEAIIIEIYKLISPIDSSTPTSTVLNGSETVFVDPVDPVGNPLSITWKLDGNVIAGQTGTSLNLANQSISGGAHTLSVTVKDTTLLVRNENARTNWMTKTLTWNMLVGDEPGGLSPPLPNPMTFANPPHGISPTEMSMTATTATDASPPVQYQFDFTAGGNGGTDSAFQTSETYIDAGLNANSSYTYRVRARDSHQLQLTGQYSEPVSGYTLIQTPTGISFPTVTTNSLVLNATGTLSFVNALSSGVYFDSFTPGGDTGLNEWIQTISDTATGLQPNTVYTFQVKARNRIAIETPYCSPVNKTTLAETPPVPSLGGATSNTMQINPSAGVNPSHTELAIWCIDSNPPDPIWNFKYVSSSGGPVATGFPFWQTDASWGTITVAGLTPSTMYTFVVRARNLESVETSSSPSASLATDAPPCPLLGDVNADGLLNARDIAAFVHAKLNQSQPGEQPGCANYGMGTLNGDIAAFIADLIEP